MRRPSAPAGRRRALRSRVGAVKEKRAGLVGRGREEVIDPEYWRIRDVVYQTCGIYQSDEKLYLLVAACKRRLASGGVKVTSAKEYLNALTSIAYKETETR